ncbi:NADH-quinone oxidoreductase subunit NuoG [Nitrosococcus wardiae]|uniref:NADH-quinone oxidoreductase n=1 Tax=Nitrosococcus wardiae TaxID=1814290 RepID=A0A4V1AW67_9GAMM|nr:NADH-quinone oxidoreductase subunit NuoG [Nitrosococcus wardiae]QBQ55575.1 NADH-quinone oxidoreductase subunit NuoG [Nitrosococcus wardiae]
MAIIHIDDQSYEVDAGHNLLQACLSLGFDLPYFCWHPAMGSVGACRQCAVKQFQNEEDTKGRIVMSCMTPAQDSTRISIHDPEAKAFRTSIIEWLMINHPHDCPVCEEGGECHLQDMTQLTGHTYRRYRFKKRTFRNQYLGPFVKHEMNRCIACYRCVRFYREYAGGKDLNVFATHHHVYFGRHEDGVLENEFSGNLVEVCPTGVFTDKTLSARYTRKWDLQTAPSLCVHCSLGCNTSPGERYGELRRIQNRYSQAVNGYFLCDRGRFGYDFVNSDRRIRQPLWREKNGEKAEVVPKAEARQYLASLLSQAGRIIGIGSPRASLEANFALRTLVGPENFYSGIAAREQQLISLILHILKNRPVRSASLQDAEQADAILILGEDVTNTAPRLALTLRQSVRHRAFEIADQQKIPRWQDSAVRNAAQQQRNPLFIASPVATRLDDIATQTWHAAPEDLARLGFAVAHELNSEAPAVANLSEALRKLAQPIAQALTSAKRPLIISGTGCQSETIIQAAANVASALGGDDNKVNLLFTVPECNSLGLGLMEGGDLGQAFQALEKGTADTLIVLENDLYRRADKEAIDAALSAAKQLILIDHINHATAAKAQLALPAATFAEGDGTLVNQEGRAQRFFQVFVPEGDIQESWRWLKEAITAAGHEEGLWHDLDGVTRACAESIDSLRNIPQAAPPATFRIQGMRIAREPHRYSGRTAMGAHLSVHEPKPPADPDSPFSFSMEGYYGQLPGALIPYFWAPAWNSVQSVNKFQEEVGGPLRGGIPGIRLIEPPPEAKAIYFEQTPPAFPHREDQWLILPLYHIFGSEELSILAPAIAERAPRPYLALHPEDAAKLEVAPGGGVELILAGKPYHLPVCYQKTLPQGIAGIPWGLPALKDMAHLPAWGQLSKEVP